MAIGTHPKYKIILLGDNVAKGTAIMRLTERHPTVHTPTEVNKQVSTQVYNRKGPHTVQTPTKVNKQVNTQVQVYNRKELHSPYTYKGK